MLKLVSDENFNGDILRGLYRRRPDLNIIRVQDVGLSAAHDPHILDWAAVQGRILLSHDRDTMPNFAYDRVRAGQPMPGVFAVSDLMPVGQAIDEILLAIECLRSALQRLRHFPSEIVATSTISLQSAAYLAADTIR